MNWIEDFSDDEEDGAARASCFSELLSCPFCRSNTFVKLYEVTANNGYFGMWRIGCGCCGFHSFRETAKDAVEVWNRAAR